jgi:hypothetical protein
MPVKRREAAAPDTPDMLAGARDSRPEMAGGPVTQTDPCSPLHESPQQAARCAENLAARLNTKAMPSEYYLG